MIEHHGFLCVMGETDQSIGLLLTLEIAFKHRHMYGHYMLKCTALR
jgi:hypothetical protein